MYPASRTEIPAYSLAHPHSPTNGQRQPTFAVPSNFTTCLFDSSPLPKMFLALLAVLLIDGNYLECLSDDADAQLLCFDVWWGIMNLDGNGRWMGRGARRPRADGVDQVWNKTFSGSEEQGESRVAAAEYTWYPTGFPLFPFNRLPQDSRSCLMTVSNPLKSSSS